MLWTFKLLLPIFYHHRLLFIVTSIVDLRLIFCRRWIVYLGSFVCLFWQHRCKSFQQLSISFSKWLSWTVHQICNRSRWRSIRKPLLRSVLTQNTLNFVMGSQCCHKVLVITMPLFLMPGKKKQKKRRPFEESWALLVEERFFFLLLFLIIVTTFLVKNSKTPAVKILKTVAFEGFVHIFIIYSHCT